MLGIDASNEECETKFNNIKDQMALIQLGVGNAYDRLSLAKKTEKLFGPVVEFLSDAKVIRKLQSICFVKL